MARKPLAQRLSFFKQLADLVTSASPKFRSLSPWPRTSVKTLSSVC